MKNTLVILILIIFSANSTIGQNSQITLSSFNDKNSFDIIKEIIKYQSEYINSNKTTTKQKLDSVDTYEYDNNTSLFKKVYVKYYDYNSIGLNTKETVHYIYGDSVQPIDMIEYIYYQDNTISEVKKSYWQSTTNNWKPNNKTNTIYYPDSTVFLFYEWHTNVWDEAAKAVELYTNSIRTVISYFKSSNKWHKSYKRVYYFNPTNIDTLIYEYDYINNNWVNDYKQSNALDSNNNTTKHIRHRWYGVWETEIKIENSFDSINNKILRNGYSGYGYPWVHKSICNYTYNSSNKITTYIEHISAGTVWMKNDSIHYTQSSNNNLTNIETYFWYHGFNYWVKSENYSYSYDLSYIRSDLVLPYEIMTNNNSISFFKNMLTTIFTYQSDTANMWIQEPHYKSFFHFSPIIVGLNSTISKNEINIYPNPSSDFISIINLNSGNFTLTIYNIDGKKIKEAKLKSNKLDINSLPNGIYIINITDGDISIVKKFVKI